MISFKMPAVGREKNPQNSIWLSSVFVLPTVNVFLEGDRAGSWWKPFIFLEEAGQEMEESLRAQRLRGTQNDVLSGAWPPPTECDFEGSHSKISARGPEFLATALSFRPISLSPCIYPVLLFPYCNLTEEFFSTWRWKVYNRPPHKQSLFSRP